MKGSRLKPLLFFMQYFLPLLTVTIFFISCQEQKPSFYTNTIEGFNSSGKNISNRKINLETANNSYPDSIVIPSKVQYSWLENYYPEDALINQILPPPKHQRIIPPKGSFSEWLHFLPLAPKGSPVMLYDGQPKSSQKMVCRVIDIDIGERDLQQCADAVMRLKAEFHYSQKDYANIHFNYTNGQLVKYTDWAAGRKPRMKGNKVYFSAASSSTYDYSYSNFKKYLQSIYIYAGTASLAKELKPKLISEIIAGDVFIKGGFPGHAVIVVDVAKSPCGKKVFLLAQSYMPAQSIHILQNWEDPTLSPWFSEKLADQLITPEWTFEQNMLKTFE